MAEAALKVQQKREAHEKDLGPLARHWTWVADLEAFRAKEVKKGIPFKDRLFIIKRPHFIQELGRYSITRWDESGLLRLVTAGEILNMPTCWLCEDPVVSRLGTMRGQKLPCGHVFYERCISKLMDWQPFHPHCPNCKEVWTVHTFPKWEMPGEAGGATEGFDRFRRFKSWIRWIHEKNLFGEEEEFSDLDDSDDDETAGDQARLPCAGNCGYCNTRGF